jgi:hypothetical protein
MSNEATQEPKVSDVFPPAEIIPLLYGKKAVLGLFTLGHVVEAEEKYGSLDDFLAKFKGDSIKLKVILDTLYLLLENKEDFKDATDFARHIPVSKAVTMKESIMKQIAASMPATPAPRAAGKAKGGAAGN